MALAEPAVELSVLKIRSSRVGRLEPLTAAWLIFLVSKDTLNYEFVSNLDRIFAVD